MSRDTNLIIETGQEIQEEYEESDEYSDHSGDDQQNDNELAQLDGNMGGMENDSQ